MAGINMKYVSLTLLIIFTSAQVLTMKYASSLPGVKFNSTTAVLMGEVMKLVFSFFLVAIGEGSIPRAVVSLYNNAVYDKKEMMKNAVPAFLYTIQNNCMYIAIANLEAVIFQITSQIKLLTATLFSVFFLHKQFSFMQWISLVILGGGVVLVQFDGASASSSGNHNVILGLISILIFCLTSGFAGVYMEKMFKDSKYSIWTRNFWLAFWSIVVGVITLLFRSPEVFTKGTFFDGYTVWTWAAISLLAVGGLIIAMVLKYADNILKAFGNSASIVLSSLISVYLFDFKITLTFILGALLVGVATLMYNYGARKVVQYTTIKDPESERLVRTPVEKH